jgi:hypothetical protein
VDECKPLGDGKRVGRHDERKPPSPICDLCGRRFCRCPDAPPPYPPYPEAEDCCQSAPQARLHLITLFSAELKHRIDQI